MVRLDDLKYLLLIMIENYKFKHIVLNQTSLILLEKYLANTREKQA